MVQSDQELLQAVRELRDGIFQLTEQLKEYPRREEVEQRYTTKKSALNRFMLGMLILCLFVVFSFFLTMGTVSGCFLDQPPHPRACDVIPGYTETVSDNEKILDAFAKLQQDVRDIKREMRNNG